jgi:hypothetical protein
LVKVLVFCKIICPCVVFAAPEQIMTRPGMKLLSGLTKKNMLAAVVVDEAHLVASWGQSFRPAYARLTELCLRGRLVPVLVLLALLASLASLFFSLYPSIHLSIYLYLFLSIHPSISLSIYVSFFSIYLSIVSIYMSIHPSMYIYLPTYLSI